MQPLGKSVYIALNFRYNLFAVAVVLSAVIFLEAGSCLRFYPLRLR